MIELGNGRHKNQIKLEKFQTLSFRVTLLGILLSAAVLGRSDWYSLVFLLLAFFLFITHFSGKKHALCSVGLLVFLSYTASTLLPLPSMLWGERAQEFDSVTSIFSELNKLDPSVQAQSVSDSGSFWIASSRNPVGTLRFLLFLSGALLLFQTISTQSSKSLLKFVLFSVWGILLSNTFVGLFSEYIIPNGKRILWLWEQDYGHPIGFFLNNNHFAFANLLLIGVSISLVTYTKNTWKIIIPLAAISLAMWGLVLTSSRGAIVALFAACAILAMDLLKGRQLKYFLLVGAVVVSFIWLLVLFPSAELNEKVQSLAKPLQTDSAETRIQSWKDTLSGSKEHLLLGTGAESFRTVFSKYQTVNSRKAFVYAENEYVQSILEFGLVGVLLILACLGMFVFELQKCFSNIPLALRIAVIWVLVVALVHSMLDFPLRNPINAICVIAVLATPFYGDQSGGVKFRTFKPIIVSCASLLLLVGAIRGPRYLSLDNNRMLSQSSISELIEAVQEAPTFSTAWKYLGLRLSDYSENSTDFVQSARAAETSIKAYAMGAELNPYNYESWVLLGRAQDSIGYKAQARESFSNAVRLRPYLGKDLL